MGQTAKLSGVVFQICVLDHNHVARSRADTRPYGCSLAPIDRLVYQHVYPTLRPESLEDQPGIVGRGIVDGYKLDVERDGTDRPTSSATVSSSL